MNTAFTFPRPQPAVSRQPAGGVAAPNARESNALRASVLDAALELGIGTNPLVADWMFNNALPEEDEEEDHISSPSLTYGSSATSEESSSSVLTPSSSISSARFPGGGGGALTPTSASAQPAAQGKSLQRITETKSEADPDAHLGFASGNGNGNSNTMSFPDVQMPVPPRPVTPASRKLKKKQQRGDGYESDGGYLSEAAAGKKKAKQKDKDKDKKAEWTKDAAAAGGIAFPSAEVEKEKETPKEAKKRAKEEKKEMKEATDGERKRKKSLMSAVKAARRTDSKDSKDSGGAGGEKGYDTDGGGLLSGSKKVKSKKSKTTLASSAAEDSVAGYETDGAAVKKSRTRFFKLSNKASRPDLKAEGVPALPLPLPAQVPKEPVSLPIAERFATTLAGGGGAGTNTAASSTTTSPPPLPGAGATASAGRNAGASSPLPPLAFERFASSPTPPPTSTSTPLSSATLNSSSTTELSRAIPPSPSPGIQQTRSADRASHSSSESSSSAGLHSRRLAGQFSPPPSSSGHGQGSGSHSTLTSSHNTHEASSYFGASGVIPSPPNSAGVGHLKPPSISYPNTRALSPGPSRGVSPMPVSTPPVMPLQIGGAKGLRVRPSLESMGMGRENGAASPMPISPISPMMSTPLRAAVSSPTLGVPLGRMRSRSRSPGPGPGPGPSSHHNSYYNNLISPTISAMEHDYAGPSPRNSGLPSPNVLAYYDIPPPSPPPLGPLPTVPALAATAASTSTSTLALSASSSSMSISTSPPTTSTSIPPTATSPPPTPFPSAALLRQRVIDRTPRQLPPDVAAFVHAQRGKEPPFPSRPVMQLPTTITATGATATTTVKPMPVTDTRRYRDLYAQGAAGVREGAAAGINEKRRGRGSTFGDGDVSVGPARERHARFRDELSWINTDTRTRGDGDEDGVYYNEDDADADGYDGVEPGYADGDADADLDESTEDLQGVLDRFEAHTPENGARAHPGRALERSHSPEMLKSPSRTLREDGVVSPSRPRIPSRFHPQLHSQQQQTQLRQRAQGPDSPAQPLTASPAPELIYANRESQYTNRESQYSVSEEYTAEYNDNPPLRSEYHGDDDDGRTTVGDRTSRWSGSIYSRASILDAGASGETRERLVRQVEEMLAREARRGGGGGNAGVAGAKGGRGMAVDYIPPVPRLPDAYANANGGVGRRAVDAAAAGVVPEAIPARSWNRF